MNKKDLRIILIHGNGGGKATDHWFPSLKKEMEGLGYKVVARDFPNAEIAHENIWIPFLQNELRVDENTILIGHSSGAVCAMRYAENHNIYGSVLVGACYTDLGDETEKESGYYNRPWNWKKIKANQNWILQFASTDDPYIPTSEPRFIHENLKSEYYEYSDKGHFMIPECLEIVESVKRKLNKN